MRNMMWIYAATILSLSEAWSQALALPGTNHSTSFNTTSPPKVYVVRNLTFNKGSEVTLPCSNKTWSETIYVIWTIELKYKVCTIAFTNDGQSKDTCNDGKSLRNTSSTQSYLHIPNFSNDDVGVYKCELVYAGGNDNYKNNVAITVPPSISAWLERKGSKMVAVCKAERGKPAANISWSQTGNSSPVETLFDSHGFYTVESRLELPEGIDAENLTCSFRHPYWKGEETLIPEPQKDYGPWLGVLILVVIIVFLAGILFFAQKKLKMLKQCQQSDTSPSKSPPIEDVEEVEPYASYVQRVNSIYNSSIDLFT